MKFYMVFCLLLVALAVASADEYKVRTLEDLLAARKECVEAKKVQPELVEKFKKFEYPDEPVVRCYIECVMEKFDLFDPKTGFKTDNLITQLNLANNEEGKADVHKCADKNEQGSDSCTWAYRGFQCFMSKDHALVQLSLKTN